MSLSTPVTKSHLSETTFPCTSLIHINWALPVQDSNFICLFSCSSRPFQLPTNCSSGADLVIHFQTFCNCNELWRDKEEEEPKKQKAEKERWKNRNGGKKNQNKTNKKPKQIKTNINKTKGGPLISVLGRQSRQISPFYREFPDSQGYIKRPCLKTKTKKGKRRHINSFYEKLFYILSEGDGMHSLTKMQRMWMQS